MDSIIGLDQPQSLANANNWWSISTIAIEKLASCIVLQKFVPNKFIVYSVSFRCLPYLILFTDLKSVNTEWDIPCLWLSHFVIHYRHFYLFYLGWSLNGKENVADLIQQIMQIFMKTLIQVVNNFAVLYNYYFFQKYFNIHKM